MVGLRLTAKNWGRDVSAAAPVYRSGRRRAVDDLQLCELGETFLGEFSADARLLGAAERDVRGHVEVLVDPDRAGLELRCDLVRALDVGRPDRRAEAVGGGVGAADRVV